MLAMRESHSFGSALARDELVRLMEGSASPDMGAASLWFEHLEPRGRETGSGTPARAPVPPQAPLAQRTGLSFAAHLCQRLLRSIRGDGGSGDTHRRRHP
jgi:hypothetical protein